MPKYRNLVDAVTMIKRENGAHVVPIRLYYEKRIIPLGNRFAVSVPDVGHGLGLCPLHEDLQPSMGIVEGRDGRERFNCFGCKQFGHVVDLHQKIESQYHSRKLTKVSAAYDLLELFKIDPKPFEQLFSVGVEKSDSAVGAKKDPDLVKRALREEAAKRIKSNITARDYEDRIVAGLLAGEDVGYFNTYLHMMTEALNE